MLPYFFRHYDAWVERYFIYDNGSTDDSLAMLRAHGNVEIFHFDVQGDSFVEEERRMGDTIWRGSEADWVIVTDIDEHIYHPNLARYLSRCQKRGVTAIQSIGYEMVADKFPTEDGLLVDLVTNGVRSMGHDRLCIFNPRAITNTNYSAGRHEAEPEGTVQWPAHPEVLLLHFKQLGVEYLVNRSAELRRGLRPRDIEEGWGFHYAWDAEKIADNWRELNESSAAVPGLGPLKHIKPTQYSAEERLIRRSGLVDDTWYLSAYPDVEEAGVEPVEHYCAYGWREGRNPNFYFETEWYRQTYPQFCTPGRNPVYDFLVNGEKQDAWPSPHFDTGWYRIEHKLSPVQSPLRHYLSRRRRRRLSPIPDFDPRAFCKSNRDSLPAGCDPFEEYWKSEADAAG
jgi:hypothetical protein